MNTVITFTLTQLVGLVLAICAAIETHLMLYRGDRMDAEDIIRIAMERLGYNDEADEDEDDLDWLY